MSYTVSPVHDIDYWVDMGRRIEDLGCHSICIKDMAGLLRPYVAEELVTRLKETAAHPDRDAVPRHHRAEHGDLPQGIEAGIDMVDTAISSMSMTYGHSPTESLVAILEGTPRHRSGHQAAGEIAAYFREVRKKYARFEGSLRGVDSRILVAQVPGRHAHQHGEPAARAGRRRSPRRGAGRDPKVREDLGYIPLVTPTSQIVGTQAVLNVLMGERYKSITPRPPAC
jgi:oxaloacetate decarboxylase alpha subunit